MKRLDFEVIRLEIDQNMNFSRCTAAEDVADLLHLLLYWAPVIDHVIEQIEVTRCNVDG